MLPKVAAGIEPDGQAKRLRVISSSSGLWNCCGVTINRIELRQIGRKHAPPQLETAFRPKVIRIQKGDELMVGSGKPGIARRRRSLLGLAKNANGSAGRGGDRSAIVRRAVIDHNHLVGALGERAGKGLG